MRTLRVSSAARALPLPCDLALRRRRRRSSLLPARASVGGDGARAEEGRGGDAYLALALERALDPDEA
jgi:hypothetical protein